MVKHLDHEYEIDRPQWNFTGHLYDTWMLLGGFKGLAVFALGMSMYVFIQKF